MKVSEFLSENTLFLAVKFSVYLNRRVFVMTTEHRSNRRAKCSVAYFFYKTGIYHPTFP